MHCGEVGQGEGDKSGKLFSSSVDFIALQNLASPREENALFLPVVHVQ